MGLPLASANPQRCNLNFEAEMKHNTSVRETARNQTLSQLELGGRDTCCAEPVPGSVNHVALTFGDRALTFRISCAGTDRADASPSCEGCTCHEPRGSSRGPRNSSRGSRGFSGGSRDPAGWSRGGVTVPRLSPRTRPPPECLISMPVPRVRT